MRTRHTALVAAALALGAGVLTAVSLPPLGRWWCALLGYAVFAGLLPDTSRRGRFLRAVLFFLGFFAVGLAWMIEFSAPGMVLLIGLETLLCAAPFLLLPSKRGASHLGFAAVVVLGEALRYRIPLGGLPMASPALGQTDGPLLDLARVGGDLLVVFMAAALGSALGAIVGGWRAGFPGLRRTATAGLVVLIGVIGLAQTLDPPEATAPLRVAYVQGGGPRGLRAVENTETDVYGNQIDAMADVRTPVDLLVWPEDVVDLPGPVADDPVKDEIGALARDLQTTIVAGVVEDFREDRFRNAAVAWDRSGKIVDRYDKVHRVPFGEYVPARGLVSKLADLSAVPRDAYPGKGAGLLQVRNVELGVVISYEVFFADRAVAAIKAGGELLLVPTNASSFKGRQVPRQEVAAAQLRAVEVGRDLVQAAPTGHSVFVDADGNTSHRSPLGPAFVAQTTLQRRSGDTIYLRFGDWPVLVLELLVLVAVASLDWPVKRRQ